MKLREKMWFLKHEFITIKAQKIYIRKNYIWTEINQMKNIRNLQYIYNK